jgi:predicted nucleic acid-binding protein
LEKPSGYTVLLDSSVLFPVFISNLLLFLAERQLFKVRWTARIHGEWVNRRLDRYPDSDRAALERKRTVMDREFEEALVSGFEALIDEIDLPDPDDQHVLAAARACKADVIVTDNIDDFPAAVLSPLNLFAQRADDFIADQVGVSAESTDMVAVAVVRHKKSLTKSRLTWKRYFEEVRKKLPHTYAEFNSHNFHTAVANAITSGAWHY